MNKYTLISTAILLLSLFKIDSASSEINPILEKKRSGVCDFKFAAIEGLEVAKKPISPRVLRNRVDNERYDACPYKVTIEYNQIVMQIDFSRDVNLKGLKEADQYGPVRAGYFQYDENGWGSADENITIEKNEISAVETLDGVTVSGILTRKNEQTGKEDYCFSVVAIGKEKYATGAVCREKREQLKNISDTFSRVPLLLAY